jgi:hypothetical protein
MRKKSGMVPTAIAVLSILLIVMTSCVNPVNPTPTTSTSTSSTSTTSTSTTTSTTTSTSTTTTTSSTTTTSTTTTTVAATYAVTYNGNGNTGGTAPTDANSYLSGATVTAASQGSLVRTSCNFAGWNTAADGSGTNYAAGATFAMPSSNRTLYAKWTGSSQGGGAVAIGETPTYVVTISGQGALRYNSLYSFTSTYSGNASSRQWFIDSTPVASGGTGTSLSLTPSAATMSFGLHQLTLFVTDSNGIEYSGTVNFTVSN